MISVAVAVQLCTVHAADFSLEAEPGAPEHGRCKNDARFRSNYAELPITSKISSERLFQHQLAGHDHG